MTIRNKIECNKCFRPISKSNYKRHCAACNGVKIKKIYGVDYDPNHGYKTGSRSAWNKGLTKDTHPSVKKYSETTAKRYASGELTPTGYRGWSRERCRENAKICKTGGY